MMLLKRLEHLEGPWRDAAGDRAEMCVVRC
jgi:environmental stress-induced protein Ves